MINLTMNFSPSQGEASQGFSRGPVQGSFFSSGEQGQQGMSALAALSEQMQSGFASPSTQGTQDSQTDAGETQAAGLSPQLQSLLEQQSGYASFSYQGQTPELDPQLLQQLQSGQIQLSQLPESVQQQLRQAFELVRQQGPAQLQAMQTQASAQSAQTQGQAQPQQAVQAQLASAQTNMPLPQGVTPNPEVASAALDKLVQNLQSMDARVGGERIEPQRIEGASAERLVPQQAKYEWAALKLEGSRQAWSKQLIQTLQERVDMQMSQHIKQARIRLDPPDMGRLELNVRMDGDRLSVQLNASNSAVRDALMQSSERLRDELAGQYGGGVDVNVGGEQQNANDDEFDADIQQNFLTISESKDEAIDTASGWVNALV